MTNCVPLASAPTLTLVLSLKVFSVKVKDWDKCNGKKACLSCPNVPAHSHVTYVPVLWTVREECAAVAAVKEINLFPAL